MKTAGRWASCISSRAWPPTTCRVTVNGERPLKESTLAAIGSPARAPTCASTSLPRGVPAAITTTEPVFSRTAIRPAAHAAPA